MAGSPAGVNQASATGKVGKRRTRGKPIVGEVSGPRASSGRMDLVLFGAMASAWFRQDQRPLALNTQLLFRTSPSPGDLAGTALAAGPVCTPSHQSGRQLAESSRCSGPAKPQRGTAWAVASQPDWLWPPPLGFGNRHHQPGRCARAPAGWPDWRGTRACSNRQTGLGTVQLRASHSPGRWFEAMGAVMCARPCAAGTSEALCEKTRAPTGKPRGNGATGPAGWEEAKVEPLPPLKEEGTFALTRSRNRCASRGRGAFWRRFPNPKAGEDNLRAKQRRPLPTAPGVRPLRGKLELVEGRWVAEGRATAAAQDGRFPLGLERGLQAATHCLQETPSRCLLGGRGSILAGQKRGSDKAAGTGDRLPAKGRLAGRSTSTPDGQVA